MMKHLRSFSLLIISFLILSSCEDSPEGIQSALFDETGVETLELRIDFNFSTDSNNLLDATKGGNNIPNWGEEVYFNLIVTNNLSEEAENVQFSIIGVDDNSKVSSWDTEVMAIGNILPGNQAAPSRYWCTNCNEFNEIYLGRTRIVTSTSFFTTSTITVNLRLTFTYQGSFVSQDATHTITVFP